MWINLIALIVGLLILISAYRKEDLTQRRFRILAYNYDNLLVQQALRDMVVQDPEAAEKLAKQIRERLPQIPEGEPKIQVDPGKRNPLDTPLGVLLQLDRLSKTKEKGAS